MAGDGSMSLRETPLDGSRRILFAPLDCRLRKLPLRWILFDELFIIVKEIVDFYHEVI
jgi:hypothetical protein